jgi:hypothetical protein
VNEPRHTAFFPLLLLTISVAVLFLWQLMVNYQQRSLLQANIQRQDELVSRSRKIQSHVELLLKDLLALAATNEQAQAIVKKYDIQQQQAQP